MHDHDDDQLVKRPELEKWFENLKTELKWQRWVLVALTAAVFAPKTVTTKVPAPPDVAQLITQLFA